MRPCDAPTNPSGLPIAPLSALGRGKGRKWAPGLQKDSGLGEWEAWKQSKREGHRLCLPAREPTPSLKPGTSWPAWNRKRLWRCVGKQEVTVGSGCLCSVLPLLGLFEGLPPAWASRLWGGWSIPSPNSPSPSYGPIAMKSQLPSLGSSSGSGLCSLLQAGKLMSRDIVERSLTLSCYCKSSASPVET